MRKLGSQLNPGDMLVGSILGLIIVLLQRITPDYATNSYIWHVVVIDCGSVAYKRIFIDIEHNYEIHTC